MAKKKSTEAPAGRKPASDKIETVDSDGFVDVPGKDGSTSRMQVADEGLTVGAGAEALEDLIDLDKAAPSDADELEAVRDRVKDINEQAGEEVDEGDSEDDADDDSDDGEGDDLARLVLDEATLDSTVTVKVDGEELEVPLREALGGYQRQRAFTRKTQELAELRRGVVTARDTHAEMIETLVFGARDRFTEPELQALETNYSQIQQARAAIQKEDLQTIVAAEQELLTNAMGWGDSDEAEVKTAKAELREYASELGFEDNALAGVVDHRLLVMLDKARRYDALKEKGADLREKARKGRKTPTLTPGGVDLPGSSGSKAKKAARAADKKRFAASGSVGDAAGLIETFLDED